MEIYAIVHLPEPPGGVALSLHPSLWEARRALWDEVVEHGSDRAWATDDGDQAHVGFDFCEVVLTQATAPDIVVEASGGITRWVHYMDGTEAAVTILDSDRLEDADLDDVLDYLEEVQDLVEGMTCSGKDPGTGVRNAWAAELYDHLDDLVWEAEQDQRTVAEGGQRLVV